MGRGLSTPKPSAAKEKSHLFDLLQEIAACDCSSTFRYQANTPNSPINFPFEELLSCSQGTCVERTKILIKTTYMSIVNKLNRPFDWYFSLPFRSAKVPLLSMHLRADTSEQSSSGKEEAVFTD